MMNSFIDYFEKAHFDWDLSINCTIVESNISDVIVKVSALHYLSVGKKYEIEGNYYKVLSIKGNLVHFEQVEHAVQLPLSFSLIKPKLFRGTIFSTNNELKDIQQWRNKLPLMYIYEIFEETRNRNKINTVLTSANIRLFFLDSRPDGQENTSEIYNQVITYQNDILESFLDYLESKNKVMPIEDYDVTNLTHFATSTLLGYEKDYFTDRLAGCELSINLRFKKLLNCTC